MYQHTGVAEESQKTQKTRKKLEKLFLAVDQETTPQALSKKSSEIHRWISRHASNRIILRSKSISLFDENQNTAKFSSKVALVIKKLD